MRHVMQLLAGVLVAALVVGQCAALPSVEADGDDLIMSATNEGKILFRTGSGADEIDLAALVARVTDLEQRLTNANSKIAANERGVDACKESQQAADKEVAKVSKQAGAVETDLDVVEAQVGHAFL